MTIIGISDINTSLPVFLYRRILYSKQLKSFAFKEIPDNIQSLSTANLILLFDNMHLSIYATFWIVASTLVNGASVSQPAANLDAQAKKHLELGKLLSLSLKEHSGSRLQARKYVLPPDCIVTFDIRLRLMILCQRE